MKHIFMNILKLLLVFVLMGFILSNFSSGKDWRTASRESAGIAPDPSITNEAVLHIYGANAWGWRGWFAIHTWIAAKRTGEASYMVYDVVGWRDHHGAPVLKITHDCQSAFNIDPLSASKSDPPKVKKYHQFTA